jgi:hypothetical protein
VVGQGILRVHYLLLLLHVGLKLLKGDEVITFGHAALDDDGNLGFDFPALLPLVEKRRKEEMVIVDLLLRAR